jgi:hypothetical protein
MAVRARWEVVRLAARVCRCAGGFRLCSVGRTISWAEGRKLAQVGDRFMFSIFFCLFSFDFFPNSNFSV